MFWKLCYSVPVSFMLFCHIFSYGVFASLEISIPSNIYREREELKNVFFLFVLMVALRPLTILAKDYNMNELYLKLSINLANIYYCKTNYKICPSKNIGFLFYVCIYYC